MKGLIACLVTLGLVAGLASSADDVASKIAKERAQKLKGNLDSFLMTLRYYGPQDKPFYSLTLSAHGIRRAATSEFDVVVVVDKEQASAIIDWLEKSGWLAGAEDLLAPIAATRKPDPGPGYSAYIEGAGMKLEAKLGWGEPLKTQLLSLKDVLKADAADGLQKILTRIGG